MMTSFYNLLKYAATGIVSPDMTYYDRMRASTLMGATVQTLTGQPPLSFKADGSPLISWSMKGNGSQTGTPTPDNPVMPEFVGVRTGNLWDGVIEVGGLDTNTGAETGQTDRRRSDYIEIEENTSYNLSRTITATTSNLWALFYDENKGYISGSNKGTSNANFTVLSPANAKYLRWYVTANGSYDNLMIIKGSITPSEYIPYGYKIPLTCAGQTTPIYLGEVPTVRRVRKVVLTGSDSETWAKRSSPDNSYMFTLASTGNPSGTGGSTDAISTHFAVNYRVSYLVSGEFYVGGSTLSFRNDSCADLTAWKQFLSAQYSAGHPVEVWYVLAEPTTAIVNEPLCKIGDYADELSSTDAAVTIPTAKGQNTLTVDTDLQPSEMAITFKG